MPRPHEDSSPGKPRRAQLASDSKRWGNSVTVTRAFAAVAASAAAIALASGAGLGPAPAATPEQRIERLERQVHQVQRQVFPNGRPADTAGFSDEPAATQSSVVTLDQRLDALERQMADILRQSEENGNRLRTLETDLAKATRRSGPAAGDARAAGHDAAAAAAAVADRRNSADPPPPPRQSRRRSPSRSRSHGGDSTGGAPRPRRHRPRRGRLQPGLPPVGGRQVRPGDHFAASPSPRPIPSIAGSSCAKNLIGRALLDKGDARAPPPTLLANYRNDPEGERAPRTASITSARR